MRTRRCEGTARPGRAAAGSSRWWALFLLAAACTYDPKIPDGTISCTPEGPPCPRGLLCLLYGGTAMGYVCQAGGTPAGDAAAVRGTGPLDAGVPDAPALDAAGDAPAADQSVPVPPDAAAIEASAPEGPPGDVPEERPGPGSGSAARSQAAP